jgi:hypothetical protein
MTDQNVDLETLVRQYQIVIHPSGLTAKGASKFFLEELFPLLKKTRSQVVVPHVVKAVLSDWSTTNGVKQAKRVRNALDILNRLTTGGVIISPDISGNQPLNRMFTKLTSSLLTRFNVCLITQDFQFSKELRSLKNDSSRRGL